MRKAVVTGVAGFIGSTLTRRLLNENSYDSVLGIDSFTDYYDASLKQRNVKSLQEFSNFRLVRGDINAIDLRGLLEGSTHIFHLAGQPGVRDSWGKQFRVYIDDNMRATQMLLEAARDLESLEKFVYSSSSSIYGDAETYPTSESALPQPRSPYGVSKLAAEHLAHVYARNFEVPTVSLRYFTVFGPNQRPDMAFTRFLRAIRDDYAISVYGDGEQIRDFTYVDDVVEANMLSATKITEPGAIFNVSGGSSVSVNQVLATIAHIAGKTPTVQYGSTVSGDVRRTGGDSSAARAVLGWEPKVALEDGIRRQWEWILGD